MNRRSFLSILGISPALAATAAVALPKPDGPVDTATVKLVMDVREVTRAIDLAVYQAIRRNQMRGNR